MGPDFGRDGAVNALETGLHVWINVYIINIYTWISQQANFLYANKILRL